MACFFKRAQQAQWGSLRQWHWVSSALCLVGMLLFAITGITLNHADLIPATPSQVTVEAVLPQSLLPELQGVAQQGESEPVPRSLRRWLHREQGIAVRASLLGEWSDDELYVAMPRPGGDAWFSVDLINGELIYESSSRGAIAYLNDLHKGRDTGMAWRWFIDAFAVACLVFTGTGLVLLWRQVEHRPATLPVVGLGLVIPVLLVILLVH